MAQTHTAVGAVEMVPGGPVRGSIRPPGSKSITNRALICAAFADGPSRLTGCLRSDDTEVMIAALKRIGVSLQSSEAGQVLEVGGRPEARAEAGETTELFVGNSGTTIRFLTAALAAFGGRYRLHGVPRMHQRPIADLVDALRDVCDGTVKCESENGCPPVLIDSRGWARGALRVAGNVSSQYLSGLMLAVPIARQQAAIETLGELVSRPYVDMTAKLLEDFGAGVNLDCPSARLPPGSPRLPGLRIKIDGREGYRGREYAIEPDASAAGYFWAAAAITGGEVTVEGLGANSLQGDVGLVDCLARMGCRVRREQDSITVSGNKTLRGINVDMNAISDTVQTLAAVALFAQGPTRIRGVAHNRFKETDRIGDLVCELRKLGAGADETEDGLIIVPRSLRPATIETYDDHRMAMSLSLVGLHQPGVRITNPSCTAKTYPEFFADLERLIGRPHRWTADG